MTDQIIDDTGDTGDTGDQNNALADNWYDSFAGDDDGRREALSQFDSFDSFFEDYNGAKNRDWRADIAGDDDKFKSTLERYTDPQAFGNAHRELNQKIRSAQMRPELPENATEDQIKEFRTQNNIPLEAEGYLKNLPDGLVVGDDDKEIMGDFMGAMHEVNADPSVAHAAIQWYNKFAEDQQATLAEADVEQSRETTDLLRDEWGGDYRTNMNLINTILDSTFGEDGKDALMNGRYNDGRGFFNNPNVLKGLADLARKVNDVAPLLEQDPQKLQSLHDEIAEIDKFMRTNRTEYNKDQKMQARYRELISIREKTKDAA